MSAADNTGAGSSKPWPQMLGLAFGAIYLLIGIVGFFVTGFDDFFGHNPDETLIIFDINPFHNVVHILIGAAGLFLSRTLAGARSFGWLLAVGYAAASVYGLIAIGQDWDILNINGADNGLHIVSTLVGLAIALGPVRDSVSGHSARS